MPVNKKPTTAVKKVEEKNSLLPRRPAATKRVFKSASIKPGKDQPGQTDTKGPAHDRKGSQQEHTKHDHPNSTIPNQGSARSNKDPQARSSKQKKRSAK